MKLCPVCATEYPDDVKFCPNDGQTLRAAAPAANLVGQVIADRYHVIKKLGEGGMGQVYLAEHVKMGRRSAIKVMNPSMAHDPDAVARFNREASNASRISHVNVCAIYDFGETADGLIYLAMEFIEGEPLTDVLEREGGLPLPRAVNIFVQAADALQAAHDLGIVHRDLKPDNVMLTRGRGGGGGRDGSDVVKVVDFGIAKAVGGDTEGQNVTKTGLVMGTPEFMSPEQLAGDKLDGRSDLYSLALVFYRMLTGTLPFAADSAQEAMIKRLTDEPMKLAQARPDLAFPPGMQAVLDTALARTPVDRYQTVAKFARDVATVAGLQPGAGLAGAIPETRASADDKTQLLDAKTTPMEAKRGTPRAQARKRSRVPVAVGVVVLVGGGWAGVALLAGRKTAGVPPASGDTTRQVVTSSEGSRSTTVAKHDSGRSGGARAPHVDSAAVDRDLGQILDLVVEPASAVQGRQRATRHYDNPDTPVTLRAQAAFMVAQSFFIEQRTDDACRWTTLALRLAPRNESYLRFKRDQGCP